MAEFVELRTEDMLPELEQLERIILFEKHEIKAIAKRRKEFEYKIQRRTKCKEDYLRYIQYEMDLMKLVKLRREKTGFQQKKANIDYTIGNRINKLFKEAIFRFQDDVRLWLSYMKFCKQVRFHISMSRMLVRMLLVHNDKPQLWKLAAKWEFEESNSPETARGFLLRGLRFHPESRVLYTEAFHLELKIAEKQQQEKQLEARKKKATETDAAVSISAGESTSEGPIDQIADGALAGAVYDSAVRKINDVSFLVSLLEIASKFHFTTALQKKIVDDLLTKFKDDELTWDTLARRELKGLSYAGPGKRLSVSSLLEAHLPASSYNGDVMGMPMEVDEDLDEGDERKGKSNSAERLRACCEVYRGVLKKLNTERMWSFYLDTLFEVNADQSHMPVYKKKLLKTALEEAHNFGKLEKRYYIHWVEMLQAAGKARKAKEILSAATVNFPKCGELWQKRLQFHLTRDEESLVDEVFKAALSHIGNDSDAVLPLWKAMIQYSQTKSSSKVECVFEQGLHASTAIAAALQPMYLEWLVLSRGIKDARAVYERLCLQPNQCLEMHTKMAQLEEMQASVVVKHVRKCHENACLRFGKANADLWMDYVKFEMKRGNPKHVSNIYQRAVRELAPVQADIFISEFTLQKTRIPSYQENNSMVES